MHYFLHKIGWCTWGTIPFAHRTITGFLCGIHFELVFETEEYKEDTHEFHRIFLEKDYQKLLAFYDSHKEKYRGSTEWDVGLPAWLNRLRVLGK